MRLQSREENRVVARGGEGRGGREGGREAEQRRRCDNGAAQSGHGMERWKLCRTELFPPSSLLPIVMSAPPPETFARA